MPSELGLQPEPCHDCRLKILCVSFFLVKGSLSSPGDSREVPLVPREPPAHFFVPVFLLETSEVPGAIAGEALASVQRMGHVPCSAGTTLR